MADPLIGMSFDMSEFRTTESDPEMVARGGLGSQCFPVAQLDDDFDGEPQDGMQYLFLVRREAKLQPLVNRVANPFELERDLQEQASGPTAAPVSIHKPDEAWRTSFLDRFEQLRTASALTLTQAPHLSTFPPPDYGPLPRPADESEWRKFIYGRKIRLKPKPASTVVSPVTANAEIDAADTPDDGDMTLDDMKAAALASLELDAPDVIQTAFVLPEFRPPSPPTMPAIEPPPSYIIDPDQQPHVPSPSILLALPTPHALKVLSLFGDWMTERIEDYEFALTSVPSTIFAPPSVRKKQQAQNPSRTRPAKPRVKLPLPTLHESHWMLSLLTRVESVLDGNDVATLRQVAKTILNVLQHVNIQKQKLGEAASFAEQGPLQAEEEAEAEAHCWMIIAAITGHWKQSDLWDYGL
ncbi:hypothetical protein OIV83_001008 [Microbotryomycetes sp. JL201]|nr:hypothetical protein OIV83_001008 [Microbotryomycetes sp. JL201]